MISFTGGRTGMISAATAAVAVLVIPLVRDHGVNDLFAATMLMGLIQIIAGIARLDLLMHSSPEGEIFFVSVDRY